MTIHVKSMLLKKDNLAILYDIDLSKMMICEIEYHTFFSVPQQGRIYFLLEQVDNNYLSYISYSESHSAKEAIFQASTNLLYEGKMGVEFYRIQRSSTSLMRMGFQIRPLTIGEIRYMVCVMKGRVKYYTQ